MSIDYTDMFEIEKNDPIVEDVVEKEEEIAEPCFGRIQTGKLYLRPEPSKDKEALAILEQGNEVMLDRGIDPESEWVHVCTEAGLEGYVMKAFVSI